MVNIRASSGHFSSENGSNIGITFSCLLLYFDCCWKLIADMCHNEFEWYV